MAAGVIRYGPTGDVDIDGVLSGFAWDSDNLTYSFPASKSDYEPNYSDQDAIRHVTELTPAQQETVATVLGEIETFTQLSFTELGGGGGEIRYALSSARIVDPAYTYYPADPSTNPEGGDSFYYSQGNDFTDLELGSYGFMTFLHETGHALGLKHGHQQENGFPALPRNLDSLDYTVMTYRAYTGGPVAGSFHNEKYGFPQSYMMLDIAALQHLYGANYDFNDSDTVYSWDPSTGQEFINGVGQSTPGADRVFLTIWDGGGDDTYDLSNYSANLVIRLAPGSFSITTQKQRAVVDVPHHILAHGNIYNSLLYEDNPASLIENAVGGSGSDRIIGNVADNTLTGNGGADVIKGGDGNDTLIGDGGHDVLTGGTGADSFVFDTLHDSVVGARRDVIKDFSEAQGDKIDLTALETTTGTSFHFIGSDPFSGSPGEIREHNGVVTLDVNGDGKADFQFKVTGTLHDTDFLL